MCIFVLSQCISLFVTTLHTTLKQAIKDRDASMEQCSMLQDRLNELQDENGTVRSNLEKQVQNPIILNLRTH